MGPFVTEQNTGEIVVKLKPRAQRKRGIEDIIDDLREQIQKTIPGVRVEFVQLLQDMIGDMEGSPEPVEVKIFGSDTQVLTNLADEIGPKIQQIQGITAVVPDRAAAIEAVVVPGLGVHLDGGTRRQLGSIRKSVFLRHLVLVPQHPTGEDRGLAAGVLYLNEFCARILDV